jgi:SNF2 family DNA or RNA helicase
LNNKKEYFLLSQLDKTLCVVTSDENAVSIEYINDHKSDKSQFNDKEIHVGQYFLSQSTLRSYLEKLTRTGIELPIKIKLPIRSGTPKRKKRNNLIKFSTEYLQATPLYVNDDDSELKNFQIKGVDWLVGNKIGILADDMGLGKTVQSIFALKKLYKQGSINKVLIVAPVALIDNWILEFKKWGEEFVVSKVSPSPQNVFSEWADKYENSHILITNYEQLRNTNSIIETLNFDVLIADEAHKIRKLSSGITKGVQKINRTYFWGLTGTPVENNPQDLVTLLNHVDPLKFSKLKEETDLIFLRDRARPYVLRRTKKDMLKELPDVFEKKEEIALTFTQQKKYNQIWNERMHITNEKGSYFATLNMLRDICDHFEGSSSKAEKAFELIKQNIEKDEKTIIFSYYKSVFKILEDILINKGIEFTTIYGSDSNEERTTNLNNFKTKSNLPVILLSARIAGEGLTITEANNVIFLNEWWNPSNNNQAKDRVIRIGQDKNVNITTFYSKGTIEERLKNILETKTELYENLIDGLVDNETLGKTLLQN